MSKPIIEVEQLSKKFVISHEQSERAGGYIALRDVIANKAKNIVSKKRIANTHKEDFFALNDINFHIHKGDRVGIIGRNGAGKSTLLKILSRITEPSSGTIRMRGRVASLLEVGTGFHPELTGRENIFLNGAILGMTRGEIKKKFDEIVAFAETEKFLDTPVKRYSSGMYVRLAFAIAAHLEPEILVVDEVLAVGDAQFQKKCLGKMEDVSNNEGRTVLFVSHNMSAIKKLTQKCVYLKGGRLAAEGKTMEVIDLYMGDSINLAARELDIAAFRRSNRNAIATIQSIMFNNKQNEYPKIAINEAISCEMEIAADKNIQMVVLNMVIKNADGEIVATLSSQDKEAVFEIKSGKNIIEFSIVQNFFTPGKYFADIGLSPADDGFSYDVLLDFPLFEIYNDGQIVYWLDRPFGNFIIDNINWSNR